MPSDTVGQALIACVGRSALSFDRSGFVASAKDVEITVGPDQTLLRTMLPDGTSKFGASSFDLDAVLENRNGVFHWIGWD